MDYKSFQKAITDRLGSQFGVSVLITTIYLHWELMFKLIDITQSMDEKIEIVKEWVFPFWLEVWYILVVLFFFQLGTLIAKTMGSLTNDIAWGWILKGIRANTRYVDKEDFDIVVNARNELQTTSDSYNSQIDKLKKELINSEGQREVIGHDLSKAQNTDMQNRADSEKSIKRHNNKIEGLERREKEGLDAIGKYEIIIINLVESFMESENNSKSSTIPIQIAIRKLEEIGSSETNNLADRLTEYINH